MKKLRLLAVSVAAASVVMVGCSSGSSSESDAPEGATETLQTYFDAFATQDSKDMEPMLETSEKGSPAHMYAQHQINLAVAQESAGDSGEPDYVTVEDDRVTLRSGLISEADFEELSEEEQADVVTVFSNFEYSTDGQLQTWVSEPGGPLADRIASQNGKATIGKVNIKLVTSYLSNGDSLFITIDVLNKSGADQSVTATGYTTPDKRQVKVSSTPYNTELKPGTRADLYVVIENGEPGGKLQFDVYNQDDYESVTANIRVQ